MPNTTRLCACGCGEPTSIAPQSSTARGWKRGEPIKWRPGHNNRPNRIDRNPERFWQGVDRSGGPDACWPWTRWLNDLGYGQVGHQRVGVHRLAYQFSSGNPIPDGLFVLHNCHNPRCCNPAHLRLGTQKDNIADEIERGTFAGFHKRRLSWEQAEAIRSAWHAGESQAGLSRRYGVDPDTIFNIVHHLTYRHPL